MVSVSLISCSDEGGEDSSGSPAVAVGEETGAKLTLTIIGEGRVAINGNEVCTKDNSPCVINKRASMDLELAVLPTANISFYKWENCPNSNITTCRQTKDENLSVFAFFLDPRPPGVPTIKLKDVNTGSLVETSVQVAKLEITNDERASAWCVIEQAANLAAPIAPLVIDECWVYSRPKTVFLGAKGSRKVFVFTKSSSQILSGAPGVASINYVDLPVVELLPSLSVNDVFARPGDQLVFSVSLSETSTSPVSFTIATQNDTAISGIHFIGLSPQTRTLQPGQKTLTVSLMASPLITLPSDVKFKLLLSLPSGATLSKALGMGTILAKPLTNPCPPNKIWDGNLGDLASVCDDVVPGNPCLANEVWNGQLGQNATCTVPAVGFSNPCPANKVWNGQEGDAAVVCSTPSVQQTCGAGQYWNGQTCSNVNPLYSRAVEIYYTTVGSPTGFERFDSTTNTYVLFSGKSYSAMPVVSAGIAVSYSGNCNNENLSVSSFDGSIHIAGTAVVAANTQAQCSVLAVNPVGISSTTTVLMKFEEAPVENRALSISDVTLRERNDLSDEKEFCPLAKTGSFLGGSFSIEKNGTPTEIGWEEVNASGVILSSESGCFKSTSAAGLLFSDELKLSSGQVASIPNYKIKWTNGESVVYSNEFNIIFSRVDDPTDLFSISILNKFVHLTKNNRRDANGNEIQDTLPQIDANYTFITKNNPAIIISASVVDPNDTSHVSQTLPSSIPLQSLNNTHSAAGSVSLMKEFRTTIFHGTYKVKFENSPDSKYEAQYPFFQYLPALDGGMAYINSMLLDQTIDSSIAPGESAEATFEIPTNNSASKEQDQDGKVFAAVGAVFDKLIGQQISAFKLMADDNSHFDETLNAIRIPRAFTDSFDFIGAQNTYLDKYSSSEKDGANDLSYKKNPVVRIGSKTFFLITKEAGGFYQKHLAYYDSDVTSIAQRTKLVQLDQNLNLPQTLDANVALFKWQNKLIVLKDMYSSFEDNNVRSFVVFILDPTALTDAAKNKAYLIGGNSGNAHAHLIEEDGMIFLSGYEKLDSFNLTTGEHVRFSLPYRSIGEYYYDKFIKVAPNKYVAGVGFTVNRFSDQGTLFLELDRTPKVANFVSLSENPTGFNRCALAGASYSTSTNLVASFVCSFAQTNMAKILTLQYNDGPNSTPYFKTSSNIKSGASDFLTNPYFIQTFKNGNAIVLAAGDNTASLSSFYSIKHGATSVGKPKVEIKEIDIAGTPGIEWGFNPRYSVIKDNKIYFAIDGTSGLDLYSFDDITNKSETISQSMTQLIQVDEPRVDEQGNVLIYDTIIRADGSVKVLRNKNSILARDFHSGKLLYFDFYRYYVADTNNDYEYQLEDINERYDQNNTTISGNGVFVGNGVLINVDVDYVNTNRNYFIDLSPIQPK